MIGHGDSADFLNGFAYRHWQMSCTRREVKIEQLVARTCFSVFVVSSTRTLEHFFTMHVRVAQVTLHLWFLEWFALLFIFDVSSHISRSPSWVFHLVLLHTITATSDNMLDEAREGIADWNQVSRMRNFAGETVWPSGRPNPSHTAQRRGEVLWPERQSSGFAGQHLGGSVLKALRLP